VVVENDRVAAQITTAGSLFVGRWTAQAAGDYAIGSNHVLPTAGAARFRGGLSAADFVRLVSVQRLTKRGLARLAPTVTALARTEGLSAHALSIDMRIADL
jgi:histidinol dehydrogenase